MQTQTALVGTNGGVELHAEAAVHLHIALVIHPRHTEHDLALRLNQALQQAVFLIVGIGVHRQTKRIQHLADSLMEHGLTGVAGDNGFKNRIYVAHEIFPFLPRLPHRSSSF